MDHKEKLLRERKVWEKRVSEVQSSGISVAEFAKIHGFSVHQFYYWKNKFAKTESPAGAKGVPITKPQVIKPQNLIKVITSREKLSSLPDPVWLATFIKALNEVH